MPSRIFPFVNGQYYHVYNRGVEKRSIFEKSWDYSRLVKTMKYYQLAGPKPKLSKFSLNSIFKPDSSKKIVEITCYCFMPNHFHFLLRQLQDGGMTEFVGKLSNSYTKYYNVKYNRVGPLLQGEFKAVLIESEAQLIHVSRYIHLNPISSFLIKNLDDYRWSSYKEYIGDDTEDICNKETILGIFKSSKSYRQFVLDQVDYAQKLEIIKHQLLDIEG